MLVLAPDGLVFVNQYFTEKGDVTRFTLGAAMLYNRYTGYMVAADLVSVKC